MPQADWDSNLVKSFSKHVDYDAFVAIALELERVVLENGGPTPQGAYAWFFSNTDHPAFHFSAYQKDSAARLAAQRFIQQQLFDWAVAQPSNPRAVRAFFEDLKQEAWAKANNTLEGAHSWLKAHAAGLKREMIRGHADWLDRVRALAALENQTTMALATGKWISIRFGDEGTDEGAAGHT